MKSRKLSLVLVAVLILTVVLAGCSGGSKGTEVIKIGVIGPMTGDNSMYGTSVREGAMLAAKEINAAGGVDGKKVEIIAYDSKGDKTEAVNAYNRLRDQDGIVALVGATFSGETLSIKEIAIGDNMPMLTPTATHKDVTLNASNIFRACYTDPYQGSTAAVFAMENLGAKKAAVLYNIEDPYSEGLAIAFRDKFSSAGTVTNYEGYTAKDADFRAVLTKIAAQDPEVIFLPDYIAKIGVILSQIRELGLDMIPISGDGSDGIEGDYADVAEGMYYANHYSKSDESKLVQNFISNYDKEYGVQPNALAALGYDATFIMLQAIDRAGSFDPDKIIAELSKTDEDYVTGHITFDKNGEPLKSISVIKVSGGKQVLVDKVLSD